MVISFSVILLLSLIPSRALQQNPPWIEFNATGKPFLWGIATAPAHVEDALDDSWWDWAQQGRIPFVLSEGVPFRRLQFWSQPELELDLAQQTGVQVFPLKKMASPHRRHRSFASVSIGADSCLSRRTVLPAIKKVMSGSDWMGEKATIQTSRKRFRL